MREVEQGVRVRANAGLLGFLPLLRLAVGGRLFGCCGGQGLGQRDVEVHGLGDDQEQREAGGGGEGVGGHGGDSRQPGAQRGAKGEGDAEAGAHQRHGRAALRVVADVGRDGQRQLHVALAQAAHDARGQEGAEVGGGDPERDREDIARHRPQQRGAAAVLVGEGADYGGSDGLEEGEERAESSAEEHDVVAIIDGLREGILVGVQAGEDAVEDGVGGGICGFVVAVELKELREQRKDECEGNLAGTSC